MTGKTEPRLFTPPLRKLTRNTTLGYDVIDYSEQVTKIFMSYQKTLQQKQWLLQRKWQLI